MMVGFGVFLVTADRVKAEVVDLPPLTMRYEVEIAIGGIDGLESITEVRELVHNSRDSWTETVIEADPVVHRLGTDNFVGSYRKVENGVFTQYDITSDHTSTETLEEDKVLFPQGGLWAMPIEPIEEQFDITAELVSTTKKVCFDGNCRENAPGWVMEVDGERVLVADDARGIPLDLGPVVITEVRVHGAKQAVVREEEEGSGKQSE